MTRPEELEKRLNLLVKFGGLISTETNLTKLLELIADQVKRMLNDKAPGQGVPLAFEAGLLPS
ncbi:MAG: hypothetical protein WCK75_09785, partial [Elusimicrobiota bacterium]